MESKDIIKALEHCAEIGCRKDCVLYDLVGSPESCEITLMKNALELIKNQQAKITELEAECVKVNFAYIGTKELYSKIKAELEIARNEAYKEFADRFKEVNLYEFIEEYYDNAELCYEVRKDLFEDFIDKTLKELTERKEN